LVDQPDKKEASSDLTELVRVIKTKVESYDPEKKELKDDEFDTN
jgi:hypothetical protein